MQLQLTSEASCLGFWSEFFPLCVCELSTLWQDWTDAQANLSSPVAQKSKSHDLAFLLSLKGVVDHNEIAKKLIMC